MPTDKYRNNWNARQVASATPPGQCSLLQRQWTTILICLLSITYYCFVSASIPMSLICIVLLALSPLILHFPTPLSPSNYMPPYCFVTNSQKGVSDSIRSFWAHLFHLHACRTKELNIHIINSFVQIRNLSVWYRTAFRDILYTAPHPSPFDEPLNSTLGCVSIFITDTVQ